MAWPICCFFIIIFWDFPQFSARNGVFLKYQYYDHFLHNFALFRVKNANVFAKYFGENILKIVTSVPADRYVVQCHMDDVDPEAVPDWFILYRRSASKLTSVDLTEDIVHRSRFFSPSCNLTHPHKDMRQPDSMRCRAFVGYHSCDVAWHMYR
jgi:hypothetical protein